MLQLLVFAFLVLDVVPDDRFVSADGRDEISSRPEALTDEASLSLAINPGKMDRALSFDIPDYLADRVFRGNRQQHVNMVRHQMPLLDPALALLHELPKHRPKILLQFAIQHLPAVFRNEDDVVLALPLGVT